MSSNGSELPRENRLDQLGIEMAAEPSPATAEAMAPAVVSAGIEDTTLGNLKALLESAGVPWPQSIEPDQWFSKFSSNTTTNTFTLVGLSAVLFYLAERGHNPKVNDIWDASIYTSTCLSVGYGDIFAKTPLGKILGTVLMTVGPSLAASALEGRTPQQPDPTRDQILQTLRQILEKLQEPR